MDEIDIATLPAEFKELLRAKLKKQDEATYNEALRLFGRGLLGYVRVIGAAPGSIDIDEITEAIRKAKRDEEERRALYEKERKYDAGLKWISEGKDYGYYVGVDNAGVIRYICYESGDHRSGGPIYRNTPFGKFGDFDSSIERIKAKAPDLYAKIAGYKQG